MDTPLFGQITQRNVDDEIVKKLRTAIIDGQIPVGSHLNETEIAKQMAISRIPIREALRRLEQEGLVVRQPNRGVFVIKFTEKDVHEVFSLRANLESMAFEWAIPNLSAKDIGELRELVANQEKAIREENYEELSRLDMRFHEYICIKANHSRLLKSWHEQHAQSQMLLNIRFRKMSEYTPETVIKDHERILNAIENGDTRTAIDLTAQISERVAAECSQTIAAIFETASHMGGD